jgi:hypothetical protein
MAISPTDANNYIGPANASDTVSPGYPKWMYHPTLPSQIVADDLSEAALQATDSRWSETDTNATT